MDEKVIKFTSEADVMDIAFRRQVIKDLQGDENISRKAEAYRRYQCLKDRTSMYVLELLLQQFDASTVEEMQYAMTNISFTRKIIDKLARSYAAGVKRTMPKARDTKNVEVLADRFEINRKMKKTNRLLKLLQNCLVYVRPIKKEDEKYDFDIVPMPSYLYDVIPDPNDERCAAVVILSNYSARLQMKYALNAASANRTSGVGVKAVDPQMGDNKDHVIASSPEDKDKKTYIWWTKSYHFTTNGKGEIVSKNASDEDRANPVRQLPFVNFAGDQDEGFWAEGGSDLADGGIKLNAMLTNINHIGVTQGYGQLYMTGKNLPKSVKLGPNHAITMSHEEGEPTPQIGFLTANPPLGDLIKVAEMYAALLLSTNSLSTSGFKSSLDSGTTFPSGIAMMIDKSESMEDVEEQSEIFRDNEPKVWELLSAWIEVYKSKSLLVDDLVKLTLPEDMSEMTLAFPPAQAILSEQDKLEIIELRRDLGLNTLVELLMRDDPALDEKAAEEKLMKIIEDRTKYATLYAAAGGPLKAMPTTPGQPVDPYAPTPAPGAGGSPAAPGGKAADMPMMGGKPAGKTPPKGKKPAKAAKQPPAGA